jgi:hypothetical protein
MNGNCHILDDSCWEILLKAIGQLLGTAKGYMKAAGKCPKAIGSLLAIFLKCTGKPLGVA